MAVGALRREPSKGTSSKPSYATVQLDNTTNKLVGTSRQRAASTDANDISPTAARVDSQRAQLLIEYTSTSRSATGQASVRSRSFPVTPELAYVELKRRVLNDFGLLNAPHNNDDSAVLQHDHEIFVVDTLDMIIGDLRSSSLTPFATDARLRQEAIDVKYILRAVADAVAQADAELLAATELPSVVPAAAAAVAAAAASLPAPAPGDVVAAASPVRLPSPAPPAAAVVGTSPVPALRHESSDAGASAALPRSNSRRRSRSTPTSPRADKRASADALPSTPSPAAAAAAAGAFSMKLDVPHGMPRSRSHSPRGGARTSRSPRAATSPRAVTSPRSPQRHRSRSPMRTTVGTLAAATSSTQGSVTSPRDRRSRPTSPRQRRDGSRSTTPRQRSRNADATGGSIDSMLHAEQSAAATAAAALAASGSGSAQTPTTRHMGFVLGEMMSKEELDAYDKAEAARGPALRSRSK
jgi:hypothetical protein